MAEQASSYPEGSARHNPGVRAQGKARAAGSWLIYLSRDLGKALRWSKDETDLWVDSAKSAFGTSKRVTKRVAALSKRSRDLSSSEEALFQELGLKVTECPERDYSSLKNDVEFWRLVKQVHSLRRKVSRKAAIGEEPRRDKAPEVPRRGPAEISREVPEGAMAEKPKSAAPSRKRAAAAAGTARAATAKRRPPRKKPTSTGGRE